MTFHGWYQSDTAQAAQFRSRMKHGEVGNPENPWIAAELAYEAGVNYGLDLAVERLGKTIKQR